MSGLAENVTEFNETNFLPLYYEAINVSYLVFKSITLSPSTSSIKANISSFLFRAVPKALPEVWPIFSKIDKFRASTL